VGLELRRLIDDTQVVDFTCSKNRKKRENSSVQFCTKIGGKNGRGRSQIGSGFRFVEATPSRSRHRRAPASSEISGRLYDAGSVDLSDAASALKGLEDVERSRGEG